MQRRTFTKLLSSMLVVPLLNYQPETIDRHKLLGMFLDDEPTSRFDLTRPYVVSDYSYASDGRIMARITTCESECDDVTVRVPPVEKVWESNFSPFENWVPFKLDEFDQLIPSLDGFGVCPLCDDRRVSFGPSYPNDATDKELLTDYDPDDNTVRDRSCPMCRGKEFTGGCYQRVGTEKILYQYAKKLAQIPGCEVNLGALVKYPYGKQFNSVLFRSEIGIAGIVYPVVDNK